MTHLMCLVSLTQAWQQRAIMKITIHNMQLITNSDGTIHFTAMKNPTTLNSAQTWVTKTDNHHSTYPDLLTSSHLLTTHKPDDKLLCHQEWFNGTIVHWSVYFALLYVVQG